ncbi:questin oxidase family protein [Streptomyces sp. NPDC007025]|uniref:questin oxidase family protein n=1 Tax=Streptomyces sp. NPDC007025 TaxID=3364771 RepID=UPI0036CD4D34
MDSTRENTSGGDPTGTLDEAFERLHTSGPEREGWLSNHAPMAVEALVRHGQAPTVHRWIDDYRDKLEDLPGRSTRVTAGNWTEALGDPRRLGDWIGYFARQVEEHPWRDVLALWWPRLLPGISAGATHPVIRTGHAVRVLLADGPPTAPRLAELAHALGYWAARHSTLPEIGLLPREPTAAAGLEAVPLIADRSGGIRERLARITALPRRPRAGRPGPDAIAADGAIGHDSARAGLREIVRAATHRYATHAHGSPVMLVHAATAPNAVLRTLPALPPGLWAPSADAAWAASAAVTAVYAPGQAAPVPDGTPPAPQEVFGRAAAHGDEHAIKFADTALEVAAGTEGDDPLSLAAALRATELIPQRS